MLIQGIHHVAIRCSQSEIEKVQTFYNGILGMPILRTWGEGQLDGFMLDTGNGIIEVFTDGEEHLPQGALRHIALETADVDACVEAVRKAGYEITVEPADAVIESNPPFPIRMGFCIGPVGEEIEFFHVR